MGLVVVALLLAAVVGVLRSGRLSRLGELELRSRRLLLAAVLVQLGGGLLGGAAYPAGLAVSALLVLAFLVRNRGLRGTGAVALGLLLNAVVVGANGAMPVSRSAAARAGVALSTLLGDPRHELAGPGTRLRLLGDVVPVPLPLLPEVVSPGDVLVAAGLAVLVALAVGPTHRQRSPAARPHLPPLRGPDAVRGGPGAPGPPLTPSVRPRRPPAPATSARSASRPPG